MSFNPYELRRKVLHKKCRTDEGETRLQGHPDDEPGVGCVYTDVALHRREPHSVLIQEIYMYHISMLEIETMPAESYIDALAFRPTIRESARVEISTTAQSISGLEGSDVTKSLFHTSASSQWTASAGASEGTPPRSCYYYYTCSPTGKTGFQLDISSTDLAKYSMSRNASLCLSVPSTVPGQLTRLGRLVRYGHSHLMLSIAWRM